MAKAVVVAALVLAALGCVRVGLSAASVTCSIASDDLSTQIESARSYGSDLEVQQSRLSNASHIRTEASNLGMGAPSSTELIVLPPDIVATDENGGLSLAGSISAIANRA